MSDRFDPDRFLPVEHRHDYTASAFAAFGGGARTCLGVHLAYMELRMAVAMFFRNCVGASLSLTAVDDMDMINFFGIAPKGQRCHISLKTSKESGH